MILRKFPLLAGVPAVMAFGCSAGEGGEGAGSGGSGSGGLAFPGSGGSLLPEATGGTLGFGAQGGGTGPSGCNAVPYQKQLLPASILFIVDRSGSMNCNLTTGSAECEQNPVPTDPAGPTRWKVINTAMAGALDQLTNPGNLSIGLSFFSNDDTCGVTSTPNVALGQFGTPQVDAVKNALQNADPKGGTPIVGATILGFKYLHQVAQAAGNRFVVLLTDGADSCFEKYAQQGVTGDVVDRLLHQELPKARSVNIRTFVVGAPGSEQARGLLSKIADLGGTGKPGCDAANDNPAPGAECHLDMTRSGDFAADLSAALRNITGTAALSCEFDVPGSENGGEVRSDSVNVDYLKNGDKAQKKELLQDSGKDCAAADGWQYTENNKRIRICGPVCDEVRADANASVIVSVGCKTRIR